MNKLNAIVILGGGLKKDINGKWRTTNFDEGGDCLGVTGDRLRIEAGKYLYTNDPNVIVIVSGGKGQYKDIFIAPTIATVMRDELVQLGVPKGKIIMEEKSGNTWQQLQELMIIYKEKNIEQINIVTNKYHLPRLRLLSESDARIKKLIAKSKFKLLSAEKIVLKHDPKRWRLIIDNAYNSLIMKERVKLEKSGLRDIKAGKYHLK